MLKEKQECTENPFHKEFPKGNVKEREKGKPCSSLGLLAADLAHEGLRLRSPVGAARRHLMKEETGSQKAQITPCDPGQGDWPLLQRSYL